MRILSAILAIFVLFLLVQPVCGMALNAGQDGCCESSFRVAENEHNQPPHEDCRNCNPFQACTCCAPAVMPASELLLQNHEIPAVAKAQNPATNVHCPDGQGSGFWQPPRVA